MLPFTEQSWEKLIRTMTEVVCSCKANNVAPPQKLIIGADAEQAEPIAGNHSRNEREDATHLPSSPLTLRASLFPGNCVEVFESCDVFFLPLAADALWLSFSVCRDIREHAWLLQWCRKEFLFVEHTRQIEPSKCDTMGPSRHRQTKKETSTWMHFQRVQHKDQKYTQPTHGPKRQHAFLSHFLSNMLFHRRILTYCLFTNSHRSN